jgi:hypothetical protein
MHFRLLGPLEAHKGETTPCFESRGEHELEGVAASLGLRAVAGL